MWVWNFFMYLTNMFFRVVFVTCLLALVSANPLTGGRDAKKHQFPHQVLVQSSNDPENRCGGAILSDIWVLTAAHCINDNRPIIVIKAGKVDITATEATEQIVEVERIFVHENFAITAKRNDIALLKLARPLKLNKYVNKIGLPAQGKEPTGTAVVSGWGSFSRTEEPVFSRILQTATLRLLDARTCEQVYRRIVPSIGSIDPNNLCTAAGSARITTCIGDSGGPLIQRSMIHGNKIVGIVSCGAQLCGTAKPSVYTKVSSFVNWIKDKMKHN